MKIGVDEMLLHLGRIGGITTLIVLCMFYPFLPGRYDGLAVALSAMAQLFGVAGLLLVPLGVLWLAYELTKRARRKRNLPHTERAYYFALASIIASSIVAVAISLGAFASIGLTFGFGTLALLAYIVSRFIPKLKLLKNAEPENLNPAPLYLTFIPIAVLVLQVMFAAPATEFGRNCAIARTAELINDIEEYRVANGHYPKSLLAEHQDYEPSVIGIKQYYYEPSGDAYNLLFEQPTFLLANPGTREFVIYNKLDEQTMIAHDSDILRWTPEELQQRRGWYAVNDAPSPHWKYFWLD